MTADVILLKHPDVQIDLNPRVIVPDKVPHESTRRKLGRLGFTYFPDLGDNGLFASLPPGWEEDDIREAYRREIQHK